MCHTSRSYVVLLQSFLWFYWPALSLNIPQLSSLNQTELMASNLNTFCIRSNIFDILHPVHSDCEAAINRLPSVPAPALFHRDPPDDGFKLPVTITSGTCWVSVSMITGPTLVQASWSEIKAKARQLNRVCVAATRDSSYMQGGATHAGERDQIGIVLLYAYTRVDGGNRTLDEALS